MIGYQICVTVAIAGTALSSWLDGVPARGGATTARSAPSVEAIEGTAPLLQQPLHPQPVAASPPPSVRDIASDERERYGLGAYPLRFPLSGDYLLTESFGDPRGSKRAHAGVDIMANKMTEVYAVADGRVRWIVGEEGGGGHVALALVHDDGWRSYYMHLNNDTPGTDDGRGQGIASGIALGTRVEAGQLLGWVGDSGNAEHTGPHLHFELRDPDGSPVDPYASLRAAAEQPGTTDQLATSAPVSLAQM